MKLERLVAFILKHKNHFWLLVAIVVSAAGIALSLVRRSQAIAVFGIFGMLAAEIGRRIGMRIRGKMNHVR